MSLLHINVRGWLLIGFKRLLAGLHCTLMVLYLTSVEHLVSSSDSSYGLFRRRECLVDMSLFRGINARTDIVSY